MTFSGNETRRTVTFTLKPGLTYILVSEPEAESAPPTRGIGTFTTAPQLNGASAPRPDATVRMEDLRFRGSQTLPRRNFDDQQVSFARAGRYALVCFFNEHNRLGIYRVVNGR